LRKIIRKGKPSVNPQISELEKLLLPLAVKAQVDGLGKGPNGPFSVIPSGENRNLVFSNNYQIPGLRLSPE
jgi:hypothetical protein